MKIKLEVITVVCLEVKKGVPSFEQMSMNVPIKSTADYKALVNSTMKISIGKVMVEKKGKMTAEDTFQILKEIRDQKEQMKLEETSYERYY